MVSDSKPGDITICSMCGARIEFVGPSWMHIGELQPKHPAFPAERQTVTVDLDRLRARMARRETIALDDIDLLFGLIEDQHRQLKASQERERIAAEAYRELETLSQASQERALRAEANVTDLRGLLQVMRDRYHCKVADPSEDLADTQEAADRIFQAGHLRDIEVYDMLVATLHRTE